ncbi:MAG: hypothetical protein QOH10_2887 [Actinomycetota bacterium]|jgi:hypothetical protein|nr:hypothetical protein [Actinomycetota bacterium]
MSVDDRDGAAGSERAPVAEGQLLQLESSNSIWIFDVDRMRFRRVPRGTDPSSPSLANDWQPYFGLEVEPDTGAFTVALNEDGTRRLRAVRVENPTTDDRTTELTLRPDAEPV